MFAATALSSYGGFWLSYGIYVVLTSGGVITESGASSLSSSSCKPSLPQHFATQCCVWFDSVAVIWVELIWL